MNSIDITLDDNTTIHNKIVGNGSSRLIVMLPGRGYTVEMPLHHYLRRWAMTHNYDVLNVQYPFHRTGQAPSLDDMAQTLPYSQQVMQRLTELTTYDEIVLCGKSLGSVNAAVLSQHIPNVRKIILLTPIQRCHKLINQTPTLAIIGTGDAAFNPDDIEHHPTWLQWKVYEGLNHSLESDDVQQSLILMQDIIATCAQFLTHQ